MTRIERETPSGQLWADSVGSTGARSDSHNSAEVDTIGTVPNVAIQKFLNSKHVPQLFVTAGGRRFNDPKDFPCTVPLYPDFEIEGRVVAKYLLTNKPNAKIGVCTRTTPKYSKKETLKRGLQCAGC